jgi:hypothetical protein
MMRAHFIPSYLRPRPTDLLYDARRALGLDTRLTIGRGQSQVNVIEPARRALGVRFFKQREIRPGARWLRGEINMHKIAVAIFYTCGIIDFAFAVITLVNLAPL